jgi:cell division protein ZapA (FtsZ GTPase activity inhibitor)
MAEKKSIEVCIGQLKLSLRTDADQAKVQKAADLVNEKILQVVPNGNIPNSQHLMLVAITLADELLNLKDKDTKFRETVRTKSENILARLEQEFPLS